MASSRCQATKPKSAEAEKGIQKLLADPRIIDLHANTIRAFRAVNVLDMIGTV